jgi:AbrB family looped-hinge helix DNA binding protein
MPVRRRVMEKATLTSKGQLTVPKRVRDRLDLRPGDRVGFDIGDDDVVRLQVIRKKTVSELFQDFEGAAVEYPGREAEREAARRQVARRLAEE